MGMCSKVIKHHLDCRQHFSTSDVNWGVCVFFMHHITLSVDKNRRITIFLGCGGGGVGWGWKIPGHPLWMKPVMGGLFIFSNCSLKTFAAFDFAPFSK